MTLTEKHRDNERAYFLALIKRIENGEKLWDVEDPRATLMLIVTMAGAAFGTFKEGEAFTDSAKRLVQAFYSRSIE